jgi:hypothetical protein
MVLYIISINSPLSLTILDTHETGGADLSGQAMPCAGVPPSLRCEELLQELREFAALKRGNALSVRLRFSPLVLHWCTINDQMGRYGGSAAVGTCTTL